MNKIRVLIADDHTLPRAGLASLLRAQPDLDVVGEAGTLPEVIEKVSRLAPDVVLLDLSMPAGGGLGAIAEVRKTGSRSRFLALAGHDEPSHLLTALAAGVSGYLLKTADLADLGSAIRAVAKGRTFVAATLDGPHLWEALATRTRHAEALAPTPPLSPREKQVLKLLALGHTYRAIAAQLNLSEKSVETYRSRAGDKLGIHKRTALVRYAIDSGLLDQEMGGGQTS
jgi:DNA-binding NarL/FixJ family response regulator